MQSNNLMEKESTMREAYPGNYFNNIQNVRSLEQSTNPLTCHICSFFKDDLTFKKKV
jgi:hypothetical protein